MNADRLYDRSPRFFIEIISLTSMVNPGYAYVMLFAAMTLVLMLRPHGLLGTPEMQILGNGSSSGSLTWFQDRSDGALPASWMLSVPILVYRAAMLLWALWLARAVLGWLRWGWGSFTTQATWMQRPKRAPLAPLPPPIPPVVPPVVPPPPPPAT